MSDVVDVDVDDEVVEDAAEATAASTNASWQAKLRGASARGDIDKGPAFADMEIAVADDGAVTVIVLVHNDCRGWKAVGVINATAFWMLFTQVNVTQRERPLIFSQSIFVFPTSKSEPER